MAPHIVLMKIKQASGPEAASGGTFNGLQSVMVIRGLLMTQLVYDRLFFM